ncbi:hypothetical protein [Microbacterium arborescens]|uniref:hypothetical protein n=1 Tax=Microbacterium arborescens TaxID=33883 RepID=UPI0027D8F6E3|nr:hypothetical protein [Microbacterium arborescens]
MRSAIAELERCGYLKRKRLRREDGTLAGADYELREPAAGAPTAENPPEAEPPLKKTIIQEDHLSEDHDSKSPASGRRRMSDAQLQLLVDLVLMQDLERTVVDAERHVRSFVSSYGDADGLIKEYWQFIEHAGRGDVAYQARTSGVYDLLSDQGRAFVDSAWSQVA